MATVAAIQPVRRKARIAPAPTQSARVTVLMTPDKKAQIEADAARLGVSSGEYIRLAVEKFDEADEEALLAAIAEELDAAVPRMIASLERSTAKLEAAHLHVDTILRELGIRK